ncbi:MAG: hypothetical protein S4CHLAM102_14650 [Chlamydiia bacterium]|nr:hypothetical protein [Chlamydiia bacterium]
MCSFFRFLSQPLSKLFGWFFHWGKTVGTTEESGDDDPCAAAGQRAKIVALGQEFIEAYVQYVFVGASTTALSQAGSQLQADGNYVQKGIRDPYNCIIQNHGVPQCGLMAECSISLIQAFDQTPQAVMSAGSQLEGQVDRINFDGLTYDTALANLKSAFDKLSALQLTQTCLEKIFPDDSKGDEIYEYLVNLIPQLFQQNPVRYGDVIDYFDNIMYLFSYTADYMSNDQYNYTAKIADDEYSILSLLTAGDLSEPYLATDYINLATQTIHAPVSNLCTGIQQWISCCGSTSSISCNSGGNMFDTVSGVKKVADTLMNDYNATIGRGTINMDNMQTVSTKIADIGIQFDEAYSAGYITGDQNSAMTNAISAFTSAFNNYQQSQSSDAALPFLSALRDVLMAAQPIKKKNS